MAGFLADLGEMRERVTLSSVTTAADVETVTTVATVWSNVQAVAGRERAAAGQLNTAMTYRIQIRRRSDVAPSWRITWRTRTLQVNAVYDPDGRREWQILECTEVV